MRSLFWRVFASFWLALLLVAGLSFLFTRLLNQDDWVIARHPALRELPARWVAVYREQGPGAAQLLLQELKRQYHLDVQVLDADGQPLVRGTFPPRAASFEARHGERRLPWRRLTSDYRSSDGTDYLFIYRLPYPDLMAWQSRSLLWPVGALLIALLVLSLLSAILSLSITRPLGRLRRAVHDLGRTVYQQDSLQRLSRRRDELGLLARDFNRMGQRLQDLIGSQRQLLRDVSHELRSPLARLRVALALSERASAQERAQLWPRLTRECDRLEHLIGEILALSRLDAEPGPPVRIELPALLQRLGDEAAQLEGAPPIHIDCPPDLSLQGWPDMLERALDNLLRNAQRFTASGTAVELHAHLHSPQQLHLCVRDHGPGVAVELLPRLGSPFLRAPGQSADGHGLGLAIARRAAERHGGRLRLQNHPQGGFCACLELPLRQCSGGDQA